MMKNVFRTLAVAVAVTAATVSFAQEKVVFATNWKAQAGHGGYYQALADGTYKKFGLDVEIQQGGPQVNNRPLLPAGKLDFLMGGNMVQAFDNVKNGVPTTVVAAIFQKDPQAIFAHPGQYKSFKDAANAPVAFIGKDGQFSWYQWMKAEYGFKDEVIKPYTYNVGPFLANKRSLQQGYSIEEPITIKDKAGFDPVVFLLADLGFDPYSTTIETRADLIKNNPKMVQNFVDATIIGWNTYLYGDNKLGNEAIKKANPDMSDANLAGSLALIKKLGIVDSGDATTKGIGAMTAERTNGFYDKLVKIGLYKSGEVDLSKVQTTQFVNKGVGLDIKKKLGVK